MSCFWVSIHSFKQKAVSQSYSDYLMHRLFISITTKWCFINKFQEEHAQIINTANSSSVITPPIQSARERIPINNQSSLTFIISRLPQSLHHPDSSPSARFYPSTGRSTRGEHSGSGLNAELGALSSDSTPNMHNPLLSLLYVCVLSVNSWKAKEKQQKGKNCTTLSKIMVRRKIATRFCMINTHNCIAW